VAGRRRFLIASSGSDGLEGLEPTEPHINAVPLQSIVGISGSSMVVVSTQSAEGKGMFLWFSGASFGLAASHRRGGVYSLLASHFSLIPDHAHQIPGSVSQGTQLILMRSQELRGVLKLRRIVSAAQGHPFPHAQ
jgi:hypothetical protein